MLTAYIKTALERASCEWLAEDGVFYCEIAELPGVWGTGETEATARAELQDVLEGWLVLGLTKHDPIPDIGGVGLRVERVG
jgi:predicted RNase H-like HicB family nuclease